MHETPVGENSTALEAEDRAPLLETSRRLAAGQRRVLALLLVGYAGYYFCRSHLSLATPLLIQEFGSRGLDKVALGAMASVGTLCYALGKMVNGSLCDLLGGRRMFLLGMIGSVACTVAFALGAPPIFTMTWALSRILQSGGWAGVVKVSSRWFSYHSYGSVMGVLCLSYLFGDFVSRLALGQLLSWGMGWRGLFLSAAGVLFAAYLANLLLLRESPTELGLPEPSAGLGNLYGEDGREASSLGLRDLLAPVFGSGLFWMVCILSFGFTLLRETFNTWMPQYLTEVVAMSPGAAGKASSLFPLFGGFSVLAAGYCSDRLGRGGRAGIILVGLLLSIPALLALGRLHPGHSPVVPLALLGAVALLLMGPYSFLAGAIALDFGGKKGSATVSGWVDGIGYLGGILAGQGIGSVAEHSGWGAAFGLLALTAALSSLAAALYLCRQVRGAS